MKNTNVTATTVKIEKSLYNDFKVHGIRSGSNLQDFVEKCVRLYVTDEPFRILVNNFQVSTLSDATGSFTTNI